jgi:D-serine deaminase-like pyridoxal phosphate-dependent protein
MRNAGNYPCNDLQQVSTGLVSETDQAGYVAAEVCGVYPERNEALVNAGVTALSRETSSAYPGFGVVVGRPGWGVVRMSQEHGILGLTRRSDGEESQQQQQEEEDRRAEDTFEVGQRVQLYCNHVCITAAAFHVYFVVDADDVVRETWIPWKGW